MDTVRSIAVDILIRVDEKGAFAEPLLDEALSADMLVNVPDRRLLTQIVYGTLRMRGRLDWIITQFYQGRIGNLDGDVKNILRMSLYQLFFTQRIPQFAVCDEAVKIAKSLNPKASGLVNAILRNAIRKSWEITYPNKNDTPSLFIAVYHSHPPWLVEKWLALFGFAKTEAMCRVNNEIPPAAVRVNRLKTTREEVMMDLGAQGFDISPAVYSPDGMILNNQPAPLRETRIYQEGRIQMQDEASQMIAHLVDPQSDESILDLCAGTGGKTTHLAERMNNNGRIVAVDIQGQKLTSLQTNAARLGISIIETLEGDAAGSLKMAAPQKFDRILIDAPCSGLGSLRRNPEIKWRLLPQDIIKSAALQRRLLKNAVRFLKTGGRLVYSTCTNLPEENDEIIADFIENHSGFHRMPLPASMPEAFTDERGYFKTETHLFGVDGFFGAILEG
jgi:16S rRNA (cytosine967-C5)-methyltransferase